MAQSTYDYVEQMQLKLACTNETKMFATERTSKMWFRLHCKKCATCRSANTMFVDTKPQDAERPRYSERVIHNNSTIIGTVGHLHTIL